MAGTLAMAALSLMVFLTGCSGQTAKIDNKNSAILGESVVDTRLTDEDFAFPSQQPSLMRGREVFQQHCVKCHAPAFWQTPNVKHTLAYTTPIDTYAMLTGGKSPKVTLPTPQRLQALPATHPAFREQISRDDRWAVIFYTRYLAGAGDIHSPDPKSDVAAIFGGNCAVCHGTKGQADGPLFTAKTGNHELHDGTQLRNFMPPPANFQQYNRMYNRTDAQIFKYICEGIYPSAMPSWYGNVDLNKDTGKPNYVFNEELISSLVRHVRLLSYKNDLAPELPEAITPPPGLTPMAACSPVPSNRPWTPAMGQNASASSQAYKVPAGNPISGGMVLDSHTRHSAAPAKAHATHPSSQEGRSAE